MRVKTAIPISSGYTGADSDTLVELASQVESLGPRLIEFSHDLHEHPEVAFQERYAARRMADLCEARGLAATVGVHGLEDTTFRIGDSATQIITPMNPYMIVLLTFLRRYEPNAGFGTLMARMMPFVVPFWILWAIILFVFFTFNLPLGPGNDIFLPR